jgi:hypothetical protein
MSDLQNMFGAEDTIDTNAKATSNEANTKKKAEIRAAMSSTIAEDRNFMEKVTTLSQSVQVVNTLGYGAGGNIVVDKEQTVKDEKGKVTKRVLKQTSKIVGYKLQNIGDQPIKYSTVVYSKDADGRWVGTKTEKVAQPGEYFVLNRMYMTLFCMKPEISFTLANGKIVGGSGGKKKGDVDNGEMKLEQFLESHYFAFSKDNNIEVNDDEVKLRVDDSVSGKVLPEYEEAFGNLNNAKEPKAGRQPKDSKLTNQVMLANYVRRLVEGEGLD